MSSLQRQRASVLLQETFGAMYVMIVHLGNEASVRWLKDHWKRDCLDA